MSTVNVAKLKAELSRYLREVKRGGEVVVTDHKMPVAKLVPFQEARPFKLQTIKPKDPRPIGELRFPPSKLHIDPVEVLLEIRRKDRLR